MLFGRRLSLRITTSYSNWHEVPPVRLWPCCHSPCRILSNTKEDGIYFRVVRLFAIDIGVLRLLKMHGDVNNPASIVLSREDYLGYDDSKSALAGVVQSMLITKHMLFAGTLTTSL